MWHTTRRFIATFKSEFLLLLLTQLLQLCQCSCVPAGLDWQPASSCAPALCMTELQLPGVLMGCRPLCWAVHVVSCRNLHLLQLAGVQLVPFSPLHDKQLPPGLSGVLLGGGAVAQHAAQLSANSPMLGALRAFAGAGGLVIGEAGGLLYLSQSLQWQQHGQRHAMGEWQRPALAHTPARALEPSAHVIPFLCPVQTNRSGYRTLDTLSSTHNKLMFMVCLLCSGSVLFPHPSHAAQGPPQPQLRQPDGQPAGTAPSTHTRQPHAWPGHLLLPGA